MIQNKIYNDRMVHFLYMRLLSDICIRNSELVKIIFTMMRSRRKSKETDLRDRYKDFFDIPQPTQNEKDKNKSKLYIGYVSTALEPVKNILSNATGYEIDTDMFGKIFIDNEIITLEDSLKTRGKERDLVVRSIIDKYNNYRGKVGKNKLESKEKSELEELLEEKIQPLNHKVLYADYIAILKTFDDEYK